MVNLTSCPVFTVILIFGGLFFYSSKIALDNHLHFQNNPNVALGPSAARDKSWHLHPLRSQSSQFQIKEEISSEMNEGNRNQSAHTDVIRRKSNCHLKFPSKCPLSKNLIKYWEEEIDECFQSPLRDVSGLLVDRAEDRKYLVFQPDLGGWNNIRMGKKI